MTAIFNAEQVKPVDKVESIHLIFRKISSYAAYAAVDAATAYAYAAAHAAADSAAASRKENQQKTADIVREVLTFEIWEL